MPECLTIPRTFLFSSIVHFFCTNAWVGFISRKKLDLTQEGEGCLLVIVSHISSLHERGRYLKVEFERCIVVQSIEIYEHWPQKSSKVSRKGKDDRMEERDLLMSSNLGQDSTIRRMRNQDHFELATLLPTYVDFSGADSSRRELEWWFISTGTTTYIGNLHFFQPTVVKDSCLDRQTICFGIDV